MSLQCIREWAHSLLQRNEAGQVPEFEMLHDFKTLVPRRFVYAFHNWQSHVERKLQTKYQMGWLRNSKGFLIGLIIRSGFLLAHLAARTFLRINEPMRVDGCRCCTCTRSLRVVGELMPKSGVLAV